MTTLRVRAGLVDDPRGQPAPALVVERLEASGWLVTKHLRMRWDELDAVIQGLALLGVEHDREER